MPPDGIEIDMSEDIPDTVIDTLARLFYSEFLIRYEKD